ncbi:MAG TPA: hypothetical protein VFA54_10790 [Bryobacterales bacterium]|jgi:hypothetical protein|nr:hypothetical protein [Bryobacterales bacterium]
MEATFHGRRAVQLHNREIRVSVVYGGGHVAEICLLENGVNPLWVPPWPSIEPSDWDPRRTPEYGIDRESRLLSGILGHNLCFDYFGAPSDEEAAAGLGVHGEAPVVRWEIETISESELLCKALLPVAQMRFERRLRLGSGGVVLFTETAENLSAADRAVGWTEHVTLGPPFLSRGRTIFAASATRSKTYETEFAQGKGRMRVGAEFDWPLCPANDGGCLDLRQIPDVPVSAGFTTHLMDPAREQAWFTAYDPDAQVLFGYVWRRADFPWLGIWEENHCRTHKPWNGRTLTRGMEFGVSPFPEPRRRMIDRGSLFGTPGYRWIPARSKITAAYCAFIRRSEKPLVEAEWRGEEVICR